MLIRIPERTDLLAFCHHLEHSGLACGSSAPRRDARIRAQFVPKEPIVLAVCRPERVRRGTRRSDLNKGAA
jgi:hypothetical protein